MIAEDFSPIYVGDYGAPLAVQFAHQNDGSAVNLGNCTINMKLQDSLGNVVICTGTWIIDDAVGGLAHYQYQPGDVSKIGTWHMFITITSSAGPIHADVKVLDILPAP